MVPTPPTEHEYAIPSIKAIPKVLVWFLPNCSSNLKSTAKPIGNSITAVAVLEIHIEMIADAAIKPNIIDEGERPNKLIIKSAIRLCRFHFSIARAIINPPRNKKIVELAYASAVSLPLKIPVAGNKISGISEVTASGTASVIHQTDIKKATAAVKVALPFSPISAKIDIKINPAIPINIPVS